MYGSIAVFHAKPPATGLSFREKKKDLRNANRNERSRGFSASWSWDLLNFKNWRLAVGGGWRLAAVGG